MQRGQSPLEAAKPMRARSRSCCLWALARHRAEPRPVLLGQLNFITGQQWHLGGTGGGGWPSRLGAGALRVCATP
eukprot:COSAG04_NODE_28646_length_274_cov_0.862857_1_plen_74_part_10